jgi:adenylate cyclase
VADYSRLMGADEPGTPQAFKSSRAGLFEPAVDADNGRLVKTMGDVEFSSVIDAVRSTETRAQMAQRNVRYRLRSESNFASASRKIGR